MITKKTEYAIRALSELAGAPEQLATASVIAQRQAIPPKYLPQIIAELSRAGLLQSVRGYRGGVRLGRPANEITLWEVIEAMQGPLSMFECQVGHYECQHLPNCRLQHTYNRAQQAMQSVFLETKLSDLRLHSQRRLSHVE